MPTIKAKAVTRTTKRFDLEVDKETFRSAFRNCGIDLPKDCRVYMKVPGGGDWSNTELDLDKQHKIYVEWIKEETEHGEEEV